MIEHYIRPKTQQWILDPLTKHMLLRFKFVPNDVTLLSLFVGGLAAIAIALKWPLMAISLLLLSGVLDALDGTVARLSGQSTDFGCVLDIMSDRCVEAMIIVGLFFVDPHMRALPTLLMLSSVLLCVTSFLVVGIFTPNQSQKSFHYSPGIMERFEAFLFFIFMVIVPSAFVPLAYVFSLLVLLTAVIRLREYYKASVV